MSSKDRLRTAVVGVGFGRRSGRQFYVAIAAGEPPPAPGAPTAYPTLDDGARGLDFVEAVLASAGTGRWIRVG